MDRNKCVKKLKDLYLEMKELKIPMFSKNELLENWIENIIELDSYYAGWALTVSEGGNISLKNLYNIKDFENSLNSIQVNNEKDVNILEYCRLYLKKIEEIDYLLRQLCAL